MAVAHGYSTTFTWDSEIVATITNINGIELTANMIDITDLQSADAYSETLPGILTAGDVSLVGFADFADTTGQQAMITDFNARSLKTGIITFPTATGATWTFSGYIQALKIGDASNDGVVAFTATIKPTGKPDFAATASDGLTTPFFAISESAVITPAPANAVYSYVATVLTGISSVTLTPTAAAGVITVDGNTVTTGEASSSITLGAAGSNTTVTVVVTETSKAPVTYTVLVARASS